MGRRWRSEECFQGVLSTSGGVFRPQQQAQVLVIALTEDYILGLRARPLQSLTSLPVGPQQQRSETFERRNRTDIKKKCFQKSFLGRSARLLLV